MSWRWPRKRKRPTRTTTTATRPTSWLRSWQRSWTRSRATLTPEQFRGFVCDNAVRMYGEANPDFFLGTVIEGYAKTLAAPTP